MRLLLDTHAYLWLTSDEARFSKKARRRVDDPRRERFLSVASAWELAIKVGLGKLRLTVPLAEHLERGMRDAAITWLSVAPEHAVAVASLPRHHGDPFDRLLVAQALHEDLAIVGADPAFDAYGVRRIW